ncbi:MAG: chloride channel protein [Acidimicrobiales bacterium]|nr:chloride channel protein [Acidimicrobiales bacterium]MCB9396063.1 chloride channel protein [Acidimicrobiaceae bacterium]
MEPSARRPVVSDHRRAEIRALAMRSNQVVLFAALTGALTGLIVSAFEFAVVDVALDRASAQALPVMAVLPLVGLVVSWSLRRTVGGGIGPGTADEYLKGFHAAETRLGPRAMVARLAAAVATVGSGAPMGLEGPSIYAGATTGVEVQRRAKRWFRGADHRTLMVAGAAAGVAAIFKAPATGAVFALEVPYQDDLARRMLLPSLVGAVSGYLVFASFFGTTPLFPLVESAGFEIRDLAGAAGVGLVAGIAARAFALLLRRAKRIAAGPRPLVAALGAGGVIVGLVALGRAVTDEVLVLGSGHHVIEWATTPGHAIGALVAVLVLRSLATSAAVAGGGVGGIFIPLVVSGALTGAVIGQLVDDDNLTLFVVVGMAAFLGAGYRVPLAAVMFVAETTGRPSFVVPGVIAAVVAELVMGGSSVTAYQHRTWSAPHSADRQRSDAR